MTGQMNNLFAFPHPLQSNQCEFFETLLRASGNVRIERIVSYGNATPEGNWYDQEQDEWVTVLEGSAVIAWADGSETALARGDCLLIPKHARHRVASTSSPCVWLAIFGDFLISS